MEQSLKTQISEALNNWLDTNNPERSAVKLAEQSGVSTANISFIKRGLFENNGSPIGDAHFHKLAAAIGFVLEQDELHWETENFKKIQAVCKSAQVRRKIVTLDSEESGLGKTYALENYALNTPKTVYIKCKSSMGIKELLDEICKKLSIKGKLTGAPAKIDAIREHVTAATGWLIIIDEVEDFPKSKYRIFKEIIDFVFNKCGLIFSGMGIVELITNMANKGRAGFPQLKRRLFTGIVKANKISKKEIVSICEQHGIIIKTAQEWLALNVHDFQMLREYIKDAIQVSHRESKPIDAEFLIKLFHSF